MVNCRVCNGIIGVSGVEVKIALLTAVEVKIALLTAKEGATLKKSEHVLKTNLVEDIICIECSSKALGKFLIK